MHRPDHATVSGLSLPNDPEVQQAQERSSSLVPLAAAPVDQQAPQCMPKHGCRNATRALVSFFPLQYLKQVSVHSVDVSCLFLLLKSSPGRGRSLVSYLTMFLPQNAEGDQRLNTMTS